MRQQIIDGLKRNLIEHTTINVTANGSKVTLTGRVHDVTQRRVAERITWSALGVGQVQDNLVVEA